MAEKKNRQDKAVIYSHTYLTATDEEIEEFLENPELKDKSGLGRFYNSLRYPDDTTEIENN